LGPNKRPKISLIQLRLVTIITYRTATTHPRATKRGLVASRRHNRGGGQYPARDRQAVTGPLDPKTFALFERLAAHSLRRVDSSDPASQLPTNCAEMADVGRLQTTTDRCALPI